MKFREVENKIPDTTGFDTKLRNNNRVTLNKTKQLKDEIKQNAHLSFYTKLINDLSKQYFTNIIKRLYFLLGRNTLMIKVFKILYFLNHCSIHCHRIVLTMLMLLHGNLQVYLQKKLGQLILFLHLK